MLTKFKRLTHFVSLISLCFIFFNCTKKQNFKDFIFKITQAILENNKLQYKCLLINKEQFKKLKETRFNGNYNRYLKVNVKIFKRNKKTNINEFLIYKIEKGSKVNKFGINLIKNTKIILKHRKKGLFHFRISYIIKTSDSYKLFLLNTL